ncbi:hypothetical protein D3C75_1192920 [compost metagenome]
MVRRGEPQVSRRYRRASIPARMPYAPSNLPPQFTVSTWEPVRSTPASRSVPDSRPYRLPQSS